MSSSMIAIASTTGPKLLSGSPMPIMTTFETGFGDVALLPSSRDGRPSASISSNRLFATHTCPMISPTRKSRLNPWRPVEQNLQSRAQPTCDETQSVPRSSSGMNTVSMPLPTPTSKSHFTVPSAERCSERIAGGRTSALTFSFSRSDFARSVMASKSATPRWWIHWKSCFARNGFSPCAANHSVMRGSVKSRRLVRSLIAVPCVVALRLAAVDLVRREEVRDLDRGRLRRIRAVHRIGVDRLREVGADRARRGFLRIGCAHQVAVLDDGVVALEGLDHHRPGNHEFHQVVEERPALVDGVKAFGIPSRQVRHASGDHLEAGFLE